MIFSTTSDQASLTHLEAGFVATRDCRGNKDLSQDASLDTGKELLRGAAKTPLPRHERLATRVCSR